MSLNRLSDQLRTAGFAIEDARDHRFDDVGALMYYLRAVPWTVPGFSVAKYDANCSRSKRSSIPARRTPTAKSG